MYQEREGHLVVRLVQQAVNRRDGLTPPTPATSDGYCADRRRDRTPIHTLSLGRRHQHRLAGHRGGTEADFHGTRLRGPEGKALTKIALTFPKQAEPIVNDRYQCSLHQCGTA
jgi:hypothetical protein